MLQNEQNSCRRGSRETKDQLLRGETNLRNCRKEKKNLAIGFIDYKKAYDIVPNSCLKETVKLISNGDTLDEASIQCGIFQRDLFSPLPFIIILLSINSTNYGNLLSKETPIDHILLMDDLKLYFKTERELQSLIVTYSSDNIERYWQGIWKGQI